MAPLRLPAELRTLWEKVALGTSQGLRVEPYPRLKSPEFALEHWDSMRPILGEIVPPNLFVLVGYESHGCMSVELDMDGVQGGALFDWFISSPGGYVRRYNHLSEWLEDITAAVERGAYNRSEHADGMWLIIPNSYQLDQVRRNRAAGRSAPELPLSIRQRRRLAAALARRRRHVSLRRVAAARECPFDIGSSAVGVNSRCRFGRATQQSPRPDRRVPLPPLASDSAV